MTRTAKVLVFSMLAISLALNAAFVYSEITTIWDEEIPVWTENENRVLNAVYLRLAESDMAPIRSYPASVEPTADGYRIRFNMLEYLRAHESLLSAFYIVDGCSRMTFDKQFNLLGSERCG